jgi:hypothetical protein
MSEVAALQTQRTKAPSGNSYSLLVQRKCACGGSAVLTGSCMECERKKRLGQPLQTKLRINEPGDEYEQEADRVADRVMRMPEQAGNSTAARFEGKEMVKPTVSGSHLSGVRTAPAIVEQVLSSPGEPLDVASRAFFEPRLGHDFSQIRIHSDSRAAESARSIQALAYAVDRDLVFGSGQFAPRTPAGRQLIAHELSHVVQQNGHDFPHAMVQRKAKLPEFTPEPVDCTKEITVDYDCFDLIGEMIRLNAEIRENDSYINRYDSGELPFDKEVYDIRVKRRSELRNQYNEKELIRSACCATHPVPQEAPTAPPSAAPKPVEPETSSENK